MKRSHLLVACLVLGGAVGGFGARSALQGQIATPAIPKELTSYRDIVKGVLPAVVSIESKAKPAARDRRRNRTQVDPRTPEEFRRFFKDFQPQQDSDDGHGSACTLKRVVTCHANSPGEYEKNVEVFREAFGGSGFRCPRTSS